MTESTSTGSDRLTEWLEHVGEKDSTQFLMAGIAHDKGISLSDLSSWYGIPRGEMERWIEELKSTPLPISVAKREGVDFGEIAETSGLSDETVIKWFESLESEPVERAAEIIRRYGQRNPGPLLSGTRSTVHHLSYDVIKDQGWSLDEAVFEKARGLELDLANYGRFVVEPGESILEAAEKRGRSWPYACRGGACANCAVIVKEGDIAMPGQSILTSDQVKTLNARLTCVGVPVTTEVKLITNVQHLDELQNLRLPSPMSSFDGPM